METKSVYTWSIPSVPNIQKVLLCHGYTREHYNKYVTAAIIDLVAHFYSFDLYTINDIKNSTNSNKFTSPIFILNSIKFYFELWPRGVSDDTQAVVLFICLVSFPWHIYKVNVSYTLSLKETNTIYDDTYIFRKDDWYDSWPDDILQFKQIQDLDTFTFQIQIHSLSVEPTESILPSPSLLTLPPLSYTWTVEDKSMIKRMQNASNVYGFASPIFQVYGFKFHLTFYPNGSKITRKNKPNMFLNLLSVPSKDIVVQVEQRLYFMDYYDQLIHRHDMKTPGCGLIGGSTKDLLKLDRLYLTAEITLIDVYKGLNADKSILTEHLLKWGDQNVTICSVPSKEYIWSVPHHDLLSLQEPDFNAFHHLLFKKNALFMMYKLEWMVTMSISGNITLQLISEDVGYDIISMRCYVSLIELDVRYAMKGIFDKVHRESSWRNDRISMEKFKQLETCTIKLEMQLIDVFYEGQNITKAFLE